jgi:hypothetical protein
VPFILTPMVMVLMRRMMPDGRLVTRKGGRTPALSLSVGHPVLLAVGSGSAAWAATPARDQMLKLALVGAMVLKLMEGKVPAE